MPTYIHLVAVSSENYTLFREVLAEFIQEHPSVIESHGVGFLGHNYMVYATENIAKVFREKGLVCSVSEL
jgi:hypothetical protein